MARLPPRTLSLSGWHKRCKERGTAGRRRRELEEEERC